MNTLEERLTEIVEKEQSDAIIPFLQKLTEEERKQLITHLSQLDEYYKKFVNLKENTYGTRATQNQHRILNLAAFVIFPYKEFSKNQWGIYVEQINEIRAWHIPNWLNKYYKEKEGKGFGGFYNMDYEVLMDWIDEGILNITPSPQTIASYLVSFVNTTTVLLKREITLKEHIWYLFEYECGQNFVDSRNGETPYYPYKYLIENGKLDRMRVMREALLATNRNMNKNLCAWFAGMFVALNPTAEEQLALQSEMFAVLSVPHSRPINIILGVMKELCLHPQFDIKEFISQTSILFASDVKAVHQNTLAILTKIAKEKKEYRDAICCTAAQGLMSQDESTQSKIAKLIQTYGDTTSESLNDALSTYAEIMLTNTRKELVSYMQRSMPDVSSDSKEHSELSGKTSDSFALEPIEPIIREDNQIPEITSSEDLIFLASQVLEGNELYHFDQLLGALVKWDKQLEATQVSQWMPILQRAYKLIISGGGSRNGILDQMMATFLIDYSKILANRFSNEGEELKKLHKKMVKDDESRKEEWSYCNLQQLSIRQEKCKKDRYEPQRQLLCRTLDLLEDAKNQLPLLSTPTHAIMYIDPTILIQRINQYQKANIEPDDIDMQIALSRVALDNASQVVPLITKELEGEFRNLLLFLFGEKEASPQSPFTHPSWWMVAGLIKSTETIYREFKDLPYSKGSREFLTGNFAWHTKQTAKSYSDYSGKIVEWTSHDLVINLLESENVKINKKGEYDESIYYRSYAKNPLFIEMYPQIAQFYEIHNDISRLMWLAPNFPEPLIIYFIRRAMFDPRLDEVREVAITQALTSTLHQLRHTWHETSYLLEATSMLIADKTSRSYAAEIWIDRVSKGLIDSKRIGKILGLHQSTGWGPMKRLTDLIQQQMINVSPLHNIELEKLLTSMIASLPENPVKDLKKLLEIYAELLALNNSKVTNKQVLQLLSVWKGVANLKKVVSSLQG